MNGGAETAERLFGIFLLAIVLIMPPLLLVFDRPADVGGIPLLYFYLFAAWGGLIVLLAAVTELAGRSDRDIAPDQPPQRDSASG